MKQRIQSNKTAGDTKQISGSFETIFITPFDMDKMDAKLGQFIYKKGDVTVTLTRRHVREFAYDHNLD